MVDYIIVLTPGTGHHNLGLSRPRQPLRIILLSTLHYRHRLRQHDLGFRQYLYFDQSRA